MKYAVRINARTLSKILDAARYIAVDCESPGNAEAWTERLWDAIGDLELLPRRHPADEWQTAVAGRETRKLIHGPYIVFFQIDEEHRVVNVVAFEHGSTRGMNPGE